MTVVLAGLPAGSWFLRFAVVLAVPVMGAVVAVFVSIYAPFTGAHHLVGVYFRRHYDALERKYLV